MKKVLISFGNEKYYSSLDLLEKTAIEVGKVDEFKRYTPAMLEGTEFWRKNNYLLSQPRGAGYWVWKPYIIMMAMQSLENGDAVIYSDAGLKVIDNLSPLFDALSNHPNDGKVIFRVPWIGAEHKAKYWTKKDCFVLTESDKAKYWDAPMTNGAVSVWEKNDKNIEFLKEWQWYIRNVQIVTDMPNMCGANYFGFKDHRHDQSVLTILTVRNNYELFRDPTQWGNEELNLFSNSPYPQLFYHHRGNI